MDEPKSVQLVLQSHTMSAAVTGVKAGYLIMQCMGKCSFHFLYLNIVHVIHKSCTHPFDYVENSKMRNDLLFGLFFLLTLFSLSTCNDLWDSIILGNNQNSIRHRGSGRMTSAALQSDTRDKTGWADFAEQVRMARERMSGNEGGRSGAALEIGNEDQGGWYDFAQQLKMARERTQNRN